MSAAPALRDAPSPDEEIGLAQTEILSGNAAQAIARLEALPGRANLPVANYWLSAAYGMIGDSAKQNAALRQAQMDHAARVIFDAGADITRLQSDPAYAAHVGGQLYIARQLGAATLALSIPISSERAVMSDVLSYGLSLQHQGRIEEAIDVFTTAITNYPHSRMHEFLLYAYFFADNGVARHAQEVRRWAELYAPRYDRAEHTFPNTRDANRKLKIGYVAPSIVGTQVRQFFMPALDAHDRERFDIHLYVVDAEVEGNLPAKIVSIGGLDDAQVYDRIRADEIDILVDLWGHTGGGRLGVFARKAAPIQAAWINYVQSTGLAAIDYVFHCDCMHTPETADLFAEKIWSLGPIHAPFRPDGKGPEGPTPALKNGYVTFGCFNHPAKVNAQSIAAWARILKASPGSRLVLKYSYYADPILRNTICVRFAAHGVGPEQIEFRGHSTGPEYLRQFGDIDMALDPSPCPGGTTSSEAIASGVPVLVLRGEDFYARLAAVHADPLGLPQLVAETWDDYVERALSLTADFDALDALRQNVRKAFETSPARDEAGFTRRLESAYRGMFAKWCDENG